MLKKKKQQQQQSTNQPLVLLWSHVELLYDQVYQILVINYTKQILF